MAVFGRRPDSFQDRTKWCVRLGVRTHDAARAGRRASIPRGLAAGRFVAADV